MINGGDQKSLGERAERSGADRAQLIEKGRLSASTTRRSATASKPWASLSIPSKSSKLRSQLDSLGISRIEAGFPRVSADDAEAFGLVCRAGLRAEIWGFARAVQADLDEVIRLGAHATVIEIPASEIKLRAYGITAEDSIRRAADAVRHAVKHGLSVAFFPVDGTRADLTPSSRFVCCCRSKPAQRKP